MTSQLRVVFNHSLPPLAIHTLSTLGLKDRLGNSTTPPYVATPNLVLFTPLNRLWTPMHRRSMCLLKKKNENNRIALLCLEARARSEGYMAKAFNLHWLGVSDLVFATRVDGWSFASCRC